MLKYFELQPGTPADIVSFERRMMASLVAGLLVGALVSSDLVKEFENPYLGIGLIFALLGAAFLLTLFISRRRSNVARWLLVIATAISVVPWITHIDMLFSLPAVGNISIVPFLLVVAALYKLFRPHARAWFRGERYTHVDADGVPDDEDV